MEEVKEQTDKENDSGGGEMDMEAVVQVPFAVMDIVSSTSDWRVPIECAAVVLEAIFNS